MRQFCVTVRSTGDSRRRSTAGELRHLGAELHVPLTAHVIVTPSGRYAAVHEVALATRSTPAEGRRAPAGSRPEQGSVNLQHGCSGIANRRAFSPRFHRSKRPRLPEDV